MAGKTQVAEMARDLMDGVDGPPHHLVLVEHYAPWPSDETWARVLGLWGTDGAYRSGWGLWGSGEGLANHVVTADSGALGGVGELNKAMASAARGGQFLAVPRESGVIHAITAAIEAVVERRSDKWPGFGFGVYCVQPRTCQVPHTRTITFDR